MPVFHRIYVGPEYVTDLCNRCLEKFTRDHVVIVREPDLKRGEVEPSLHHRACFEEQFGRDIVLLSSLRVIE